MSVPRDERLSTGRIASHLLVMLVVAAILGVVVAGLAIPFAGVMGISARNVAKAMDSLPAELKTDPLPQRTRLLDDNGNTIATFYDENRVNVSLSQISRTMVQAIVAIEDSRYYEHGALDLKGTLRALITNQANDGAVVQGGSSITQQMVKMTLLTQAKTPAEKKAATDDTYARKIRELRYAIAFEQHYSKDWILERYLNIAYFGDGVYGIQSAARHYFGVNAKDLDLAQSAMLAGLVKNPSGYDPTDFPDRALARRNVVLDRMAQLNVITRDQAEQTKQTKLRLHIVHASNGCLNSRAPFFCDYAWNYLLKDPSLGPTVTDRIRTLKTSGLTIRSTVSLRDQAAADKSVRAHVYPTDQAVGAIAMVEPRTGEVKAISQSRPMGPRSKKGETFLNYVVPKEYGDANGFQAGSTFKLFVLSAAINQGIGLNTTINAPQTINIPMKDYPDCHGNFQSTDVWSPNNSTGQGTFNLYTGTQNSVNTFFAQLEERTGLCEPFKLAKAMGIQLTRPAIERVPSFTLGVPSVSPLEMAEAYATVAGRGLHCDSRPVTSIADSAGNVLKKYPAQCQQVMPQNTADAVNDILRGVQEHGFGAQNGLGIGQPSAAKTGTIQDNMAVWYCGYTPNLAAAAMIAGANGKGHWITLNGQTLANGYVATAHGSTVAGPMWGDAMKVIAKWLPDTDFVKPSYQTVAGEQRTVPTTAGMTIAEAEDALRQAGFYPNTTDPVRSGRPQGTVDHTDPAGGSSVSKGSSVTIYPSNGKPPKGKGGGQPGTNAGGPGGGPGGGGGGGHGHGHGHGGG